MTDIHIRQDGRAGRITFQRVKALNALTAPMAIALEQALDAWRMDDAIDLILIDAEGEKAFCAGGDIADLYAKGRAGDFDFGRAFWRQEYRLNFKISDYPKPIVSFMQGFTMGGGVGVGCHASHRIVGESTKIAMPECGIGLVPDVGGSHLLSRAPGAFGLYLGLTGARMTAPDALYAGFADHMVPEAQWETLKNALIDSGNPSHVAQAAQPAGPASLAESFETIQSCFKAPTLAEIATGLSKIESDIAQTALKGLTKGSPLAMACTIRTIRAEESQSMQGALQQEFRFVSRAMEHGDFLEGIRARIVDRDFTPKWKHGGFDVPAEEIAFMLAPLGADEWTA